MTHIIIGMNLRKTNTVLCPCGSASHVKSQSNEQQTFRYQVHTDHDPVVCPEPGCGKTFPNQQKLGAHKKGHIIIPCEFCGKMIPTTNMRKHMQAKVGSL